MQFLVNISHSKVVELLSSVQPVGEPSEPESGSIWGIGGIGRRVKKFLDDDY